MEFFLTPMYVAQLVYLAGLAIAVTYLFTIPNKSRDTKLILSMLITWLIYSFTTLSFEITHTHLLISGRGYESARMMPYILLISRIAFQFILAMIIYRIGFRFARWEERIFLTVCVVMAVVVSGRYMFMYDDINGLIEQFRFMGRIIVGLNLWLIGSAVRKLWLAYSHKHDFRARRLVVMTFMTSIATLIFVVTTPYITVFISISAELRAILPALMTVIAAGSLIIGYLLYGEEKHSLLVKMVGFLLIAYVSILAIVIPLMRTEVSLRQQFLDPGDVPSRVFIPDSTGRYTVEETESTWVNTGGVRISPADDDAAMFLSDFPFPFYGIEYDSVWVGTNGSISLGRELDADNTFSSGLSLFDETPSVMVYYADLFLAATDAGIRVDATPDHFAVTWEKASHYDLNESTLTMQTILYPDGRIEFNYLDLNTLPFTSYLGISPGGPADAMIFPAGLFTGKAGQALFEHVELRDAYRRFVHPLVVPAAWVSISGLLLMLVFGIIYYRSGILKPLDRILAGLTAVQTGDLDAEVVIAERNELGSLADYFNRMTASLREYSVRMEELVSQRTKDLDSTIVDLRATQAQLVEQEKLASLGSLIAGIAHEIKNPLNFVNNFAEVGSELMDELAEAVEVGDSEAIKTLLADMRENAEQITKHGKRADSIVRAMMQHAKGGISEKEDIDLNEFLEEYANLAWHGMRARDEVFQAEVVRDFADDTGIVSVMPQELGRVFLNLLSNAFDALRDTENPCVTISTARDGDIVQITVSDNGPGIPEDIREKIFEPFFTTKATGEGTGLGLSLSYDIVTTGHGGKMTVRKSKEGGAEFVVRLPA